MKALVVWFYWKDALISSSRNPRSTCFIEFVSSSSNDYLYCTNQQKDKNICLAY